MMLLMYIAVSMAAIVAMLVISTKIRYGKRIKWKYIEHIRILWLIFLIGSMIFICQSEYMVDGYFPNVVYDW